MGRGPHRSERRRSEVACEGGRGIARAARRGAVRVSAVNSIALLTIKSAAVVRLAGNSRVASGDDVERALKDDIANLAQGFVGGVGRMNDLLKRRSGVGDVSNVCR